MIFFHKKRTKIRLSFQLFSGNKIFIKTYGKAEIFLLFLPIVPFARRSRKDRLTVLRLLKILVETGTIQIKTTL